MAEWLKGITLPLVGDLNDIYLIHLSIDPRELTDLVPRCMPLRLVDGRAVMSLVNVRADRFRLSIAPGFAGITYRAVMLRVVVEDGHWNTDGQPRGIFITNVYLNKSLVNRGFRTFTDQHTTLATIESNGSMLAMRSGDKFLDYELDESHPVTACDPRQQEIAEVLDRAYTMSPSGTVRRISIARDKWPLKQVHVVSWRTNLFETARVECVFKVTETIPYRWTRFEPIARFGSEEADAMSAAGTR
jgi:uncharacterized protein YqjF (DUF2071 family)